MPRELAKIIPQYYAQLSPDSVDVLNDSVKLASHFRHFNIASIHLAISVLKYPTSDRLLSICGIDAQKSADTLHTQLLPYEGALHRQMRPSKSFLEVLSTTREITTPDQPITPLNLLAGTYLERGLIGLGIHPLDVPAGMKESAEIDPRILILVGSALTPQDIASKVGLDETECLRHIERLQRHALMSSLLTGSSEVTQHTPMEDFDYWVEYYKNLGWSNEKIITTLHTSRGKVATAIKRIIRTGKPLQTRARRTNQAVAEFRQQVAELRKNSDLTAEEIAEITDSTLQAVKFQVRKLIDEEKVDPREPRRIPDETLDQFAKYRAAGLGNREIAEKMGVTMYTAENYARLLIDQGILRSKRPR